MPEEKAGFLFDHQEIVTDLIKKQGLHSGRWKLTLEVGLAATSMPVTQPDGGQIVLPTGLVFIKSIGISKTSEVNNLTVDAAEVNPEVRRRAGGVRASRKVAKKK